MCRGRGEWVGEVRRERKWMCVRKCIRFGSMLGLCR